MTQSFILAIDQGGQSSRVAIYNSSGEQLHCFSAACATTHTFNNQYNAEFIEQDPAEILQGIKTCIENIKTILGASVNNIIAAGFAGQGSSLLCWDNQTGEALTPVLSWQDIRGKDYLNHVSLTHSQAQALTGLRVSPHYGASKIRWCLDNNENVAHALQNKTLTIGPICSYIFWHLLGKNLVDPGHAQRTLLHNLHSNNWDHSLLTLFNIPQSVLPECKFHNNLFGQLPIGNHKIPFLASARDQGASLFARGLPDKNTCYINIGTGAFIQRVSENLQAPEGLLVSPLWIPENPAEHKLYAWEATVNGAASAIEYLQQHTGLQITPNDITQALELNPPHDCYFLNAIGGLSAPYWRTDLQSRFSKSLNAHEKILAWLESIIFQIVVNVKLMNALGQVQKIYISGGVSRADGVCQKIADLTQVPVHRSDNTDATLQGIACMASGSFDKWTPVSQEYVFRPQKNYELLTRFTKWQAAMDIWLDV